MVTRLWKTTVLSSFSTLKKWHHLKTGRRPGTWPRTWEKTDTLKSGPVPKTRTQGLKTLPFVSCHVKDNVKVIYFHIKSRGVQGLIFVQIPFEKYTTHFYFENGEVGVKTTITNLQPLLARKISAYLRILM